MRPDVVVILTDQERAAPPYETDALREWRERSLPGRRWFAEHGVTFRRHYTGSLACAPSRPTLFTGQYPDVHGVTQTDGLGKDADDSGMRWLRPTEVPTLGHWFRAAGYDTYYQGKWHLSHADLHDAGSGRSLATNDDDGNVDTMAAAQYAAADRLDEFGFSGWIGPEPHGPALANSGLRRDPLTAARVVAWLEDRYARRQRGDADAQRPFLVVASFVNPHDIVLFPLWSRNDPFGDAHGDVPEVPPSPTADEDLTAKPRAQRAYRAAYPTGYAPLPTDVYEERAAEYRRLYYRLHAEVDGAIDAVRRAVTNSCSDDAVLVLTADHGELLGAHGGLHQKWFNLYDEATRVPFVIAGVGSRPTRARVIESAPTSHVDIVPTLLSVAGIDSSRVAEELTGRFTELHPLPGRDLMPIVNGTGDVPADRAVYLITRDNILEGDTGASPAARVLGLGAAPPDNMRISVPADTAASFEAIVVADEGRVWKLARTFDDPATWTEPGVRHLAASGADGDRYREQPLADEWELYDLMDDPIEAVNRWETTPDDLRLRLTDRLAVERARHVPARHQPWPYATRRAVGVGS
ncbi:MAG TPA: sulfatase-like hydrolase/transferase [Ilumatobacter sp.]|nr:sulfatase-like hydrolase/transferase [Ilumatobacter sp.]